MRFTDLELSRPVLDAVANMGFETATPIQAQAIPPAMTGRDIVGAAQTGTGKTAAFLIPIIEKLIKEPGDFKHPRALILAPTRELVVQVGRDATDLAAKTDLRIVYVYGGSPMKPQISRLRSGVDIVVATPGRLMDHMRRKNVRLDHVKVLVLDEADRMLDMGFLPDIEYIVGRTPRKRQTMLFSATMPPAVMSLARQFQYDPVNIKLTAEVTPQAIRQVLYPVPRHLKTDLLLAILDRMAVESMLVFTDTKQEADIVNAKLNEANIRVTCIHGDFHQRQRTHALEGFRSGKYRVMVATNVAARGLDIEGITHVINYDVPPNPEDYIHRIGRTARAEAKGDAISLVTPEDEPSIYKIEHALGYELERKTLPDFDYDVPAPSWAKITAEGIVQQVNRNKSMKERWRSRRW